MRKEKQIKNVKIIEKLQESEKHIRFFASYQHAISQLRKFYIKQADPEKMLQATLDLFVKDFGYYMAWYGELKEDKKLIVPKARAGKYGNYLEGMRFKLNDSEDAKCAASRAIITKKPFGYADLERDKDFKKWRPSALKHGYRSNQAIPLIIDGKSIGVFLIYSTRPRAFSEILIQYLSGVVNELATIIEKTAEYKKAQEKLKRYRERLEEIVKERTSNLKDANKRLQGEISERRKAEGQLSRITESFLHFGADPVENIKQLTALCGEILNSTCTLYNRLEGGMLYSVGHWHTPADYNPIDKPDGHICYDVIKRAADKLFIVRDLPNTIYAQTDPNVLKYNLKTYIGYPIKLGDKHIGALCAVYQEDVDFDEGKKRIVMILASAISIEEERNLALKKIHDAYNKLEQAQAQLVQSAKMASVGLLASGVAHEINNPLSVILGEAHMLLKDENKDKETKEASKNIWEQAERIAIITTSHFITSSAL